MTNKTKAKLLSTILTGTLLLSGCGERSECNIPTRHVHKYIKQFKNGITIETYLDDEDLNKWGGYNWTENYIEINKNDEKLYHTLDGLFDGVTNWNYLFYRMATVEDYLEYYYEYDTKEVRTRTNSDGKTETYTETVHHSGWHRNAYDSNNTGRVRLYHYKFHGYTVVLSDGKYKLVRSPLVDDIRDIIDNYPYFSETCAETVYKEFKFSKYQLPSISPYDFDVFNHPDLSTSEIHPKIKTKNME